MGLFRKLFDFNQRTEPMSKEEIIKKTDKYIELDEKYYDKLYKEAERYDNLCENISYAFCSFSYSKRLKSLQKAVNYYDEKKNFYYSFGEAGKILFDESDFQHAIEPLQESEVKNEIAPFQEGFDYEYENFDFYNIDFNRDILKEYIENADQIKKHIEYEKYCSDRAGYEDEGHYQEALRIQKLYKRLPKDILKQIKSNDGILQSKLYKLFPDFSPSTIKREVEKLVSNNQISKEKKGSSYALYLNKNQNI